MKYAMLCMAALLSLSTVFAQDESAVPNMFTYQGRLTDGVEPVNGSKTIVFSIYDASVSNEFAGAWALHTHTATVSVVDGLFTASIGGTNEWGEDALVFLADPPMMPEYSDGYWLELEVEGQTLQPRQKLDAVPYAMVAGKAETLTQSVGGDMIKPHAITSSHIENGQVYSSDIKNGTILFQDIGQNGATEGQVIKWNGVAWQAAADATEGGGGVDADTLDGQHGSYYLNAANINAGLLDYARFSAYGDLTDAGYLNNDAGIDLLTRDQADARYELSGGGGGGGDADTLDSLDSTQFVRSDVSDTFNNLEGTILNITGELNLDSISTLDSDATIHAEYLYIGPNSGSDDDTIYFDSAASEWLMWDESEAEFALSDDLNLGGNLVTDAETLEVQVDGGLALRVDTMGTAAPSILAGRGHSLGANSTGSAIGGGTGSSIGVGAQAVTIGGGDDNSVADYADDAVITGGNGNAVGNSAAGSVIGGGVGNDVGVSSVNATIGGGNNNSIGGSAGHATIVGGRDHTIEYGADYSTIAGGRLCYVTNNATYAFAAGRRARAVHSGSFVWADGTDAEFRTVKNDEFAVRAENGVRLVGDASEGLLIVGPDAGIAPADAGRSVLRLSSDRYAYRDMSISYGADDDYMGFWGNLPDWGPHMVITEAAGYVGINTDDPEYHLHVAKGATLWDPGYVAMLHNEDDASDAGVLRLKVGDTYNPGNANNFITFLDGDDDAVGAIDGNGSGGVRYGSGGADFAEYVRRADPDESLAPGDVVGVAGGMVSKSTAGAERFLVVSDTACVVGNAPDEGEEDAFVQVAFVGQVNVRVRGPVSSGDYIVAAGDGVGEAVALDDLTSAHLPLLVGQAWATDEGTGVRRVRISVGLDATPALHAVIANQQARIAKQELELSTLRTEVLARLEKLERK